MSDYQVFTLEQRPELRRLVDGLSARVWPEFLRQSDTGYLWPRLFDTFAAFQFVLYAGEEPVAAGHTIPVGWNGTLADLPEGFDAVLERGVRGQAEGRQPDTLSALAAIVVPERRGEGLSAAVLRQMRSLAAERGFHSLIAPVRPTLKSAYPLTPMERYVEWTQEEGLPFDPWLRVHARLGATLLRVAPHSLTSTGTVAQWEGWTGMRFPESGPYVVPGGLVPVEIDCEEDRGRYREPNVWMRHPVGEREER